MTGRGAAALLAPLPVVALGAAFPPLLWVGLVLLVVAAAAVVVDSRRAPAATALHVRREHDPTLAVGRPNRVRLHLDAGNRRGAVTVRDEHPPGMTASTEVISGRLPATLEYTLTPPARGETLFGNTVVRLQGPLGLGTRQVAVSEGRDTVRVDPDLSQVHAYEALARRGHLAELGVRTIRRRGEGTDFERIREAVPDDPLRVINWSATARTGRLMAVELIPERAQPVIICIDHGRLMGVGAGSLTKLDHAINAALLLVHVALRFGDRAGLMAFSDTVTTSIAPRAGRTQLRTLIDGLRPLAAGDTEADYETAFGYLSGWQTRRALLAIFTDVLDPDQGAALIRQCVRLRRRHLPLVITVRDPAVDDLAAAIPTNAASTYSRAVANGLISDRNDTLQLLSASRVDTLDADARTLSPRLVNRYLELKQRGRL